MTTPQTSPDDYVTIRADDDTGSFSAYVRRPETDADAPCVIVIQEIFGVNAVMRGICDDLAKAGYIAVCPDLFWRQEPGIDITDKTEAEWKKAFSLYEGFDIDLGVADLKATLAEARRMDGCSGRAATMGFCLGGKLAFLMAAKSDADCNVSYYGVGIDALVDTHVAGIRNPLLMHIAEKDKFVPLPAQHKIITALKDNDHVQVNVYPGVDHAFARPGGAHYDAEAAHLANSRTADFLAVHLAPAVPPVL